MKKIKLLQKITAMASFSLVIALAFSCSSTNAPDQPQQEPIGEASSYSSSSDEQQYWCVNFDLRVCSIANSSTVCSNEGFLALNCPYSSNSNGGSSSSSGSLISSSSSNSEPVCTAADNSETQYCSNGTMKNYGSVTYSGQTYKTVIIGTQTWMAENLNYATSSGSTCYNDNNSNCVTYGRLYNWAAAMNLSSSCNSASCSNSVKTNHQGICPSGWHIPSNVDWDMLFRYVD